jgi:isocitrate/isopropylmalate dehydrogenase
VASPSGRRVAVVPGDDAAPEAVYATLDVLRVMELPIEWVVLPDGHELATLDRSERENRIREAVDACDTALFGATSGTTGGIAYLRWGKRTYANVRPVRWRTGVPTPQVDPSSIDYVIVRENLEDLYTGLEGGVEELRGSGLRTHTYGSLVGGANDIHDTQDGRFSVKLITRENTERVARFACALALERRERGFPGKVTCGTKHNILPVADGFFRDVVREVVESHDGLAFESYLADDLARRVVATPRELDVVVLPNLYGDLLSDAGAATVGGLGVCPSGCYGDAYAYFEPVHGTAPDIAGKGVINPTATMLSAVMMLTHLGQTDAARALELAVDAALAAGDVLTPDLGGDATTERFAAAVRARL